VFAFAGIALRILTLTPANMYKVDYRRIHGVLALRPRCSSMQAYSFERGAKRDKDARSLVVTHIVSQQFSESAHAQYRGSYR